MVKKILLICAVLLVAGKASAQETRKATDILSCKNPEGYEYICYNPKECRAYLQGYNEVLIERYRMQDKHNAYPEKVQVVHMNLYDDKVGMYTIGRIEATRDDEGHIYKKLWYLICDLEDNIIASGYKEGWYHPAAIGWENK